MSLSQFKLSNPILIAKSFSHGIAWLTSEEEFVVFNLSGLSGNIYFDCTQIDLAIGRLVSKTLGPISKGLKTYPAISALRTAIRSEIESHQERPWEACEIKPCPVFNVW